jgi:hypothetical protein
MRIIILGGDGHRLFATLRGAHDVRESFLMRLSWLIAVLTPPDSKKVRIHTSCMAQYDCQPVKQLERERAARSRLRRQRTRLLSSK